MVFINRLKQILGFNKSGENPILKVFLEKNCLFFHVPKTAGISVSSALFGDIKWGHRDVAYYKTYYGETVFNGLYKFCFVRNPYERLYSAYHFLKKGGVNSHDLNFSNTHLKEYASFQDFVLNGLNKKEIMDWVHFRPQYRFVCHENGELAMDFIGKMETLETDFDALCKHLNLDAELKMLNKNDCEKELIGDEEKRIIKDKYREDFVLFYPEL